MSLLITVILRVGFILASLASVLGTVVGLPYMFYEKITTDYLGVFGMALAISAFSIFWLYQIDKVYKLLMAEYKQNKTKDNK